MINEQKIPCPVCKTDIPFEVDSLLRGAKFACPNCQSVVALSSGSIEETRNIVNKYEALKINSGSQKDKM